LQRENEIKMMTFYVKHLRALRWRHLLGTVAAICSFSLMGVPSRAADPAPDAQSILRNARMAQAGQERMLNGHLQVQATGQKIPFTLALDAGIVRYQFADKTIVLKLGADGSQLMEAPSGADAMKKVAPARYDAPVEGTDITYEDLSLKFLYWPKARVDGTEEVDMLNCWKLHIEPGSEASAYAAVELWVSMRTGDFLEGEGYDAGGKLVKRFKVISGQHDPAGGWMLKRMRIETLGKGAGETITYLVIDQ
jgi:hypothetical protein